MAGRGRSFVRKSADSIKQPKIYMADGLKFKSKSLYDLYYLLKELQKEKLITCFELPTLTEQKQKTKFGSMKCMIDNRVFDSVMEAKFYIYVKQRKREGNIKDFDCQVTFLLQESFKKNGKTVRPITYIADFVIEHLNGTKIVLQEIFDGIIKGFLPLGFTFIIYTLLEKGMKSTTLLWGILILGIVCSFFGIL